MAATFNKSYRFAFNSALLISIILTLVTSVFLYFFFNLEYIWLGIFLLLTFILVFAVIQFRVEKLIFNRVKKIYDDLTLLESSSFRPKQVLTDMDILNEEIEKYAQDKKLEIETLKVREEYRKEFIGNVSHELKTPLFTVQGYISTLLDGVEDEKLRNKYLKRADKGVERLIYIIKDLDMITKLEAGDLSLDVERFDILDVIQNVFDLYEMKAAKKKISLIFDMAYEEPIYVNADKEKIQQVLSNLIVNSIKYGRQKGTTEVSIENLIKNKVIVRITDNGEGIEEENIPRIFERFFRIDQSRSRKVGGSGLGLAIVKHIIEAHDEKIYVESEHGVGSEFSFTLEKAE